jgi:hypothetical protein
MELQFLGNRPLIEVLDVVHPGDLCHEAEFVYARHGNICSTRFTAGSAFTKHAVFLCIGCGMRMSTLLFSIDSS